MPLTTFLQRIADIHAHTPCPKAAHEAMEGEVRTCAAALRLRLQSALRPMPEATEQRCEDAFAFNAFLGNLIKNLKGMQRAVGRYPDRHSQL